MFDLLIGAILGTGVYIGYKGTKTLQKIAKAIDDGFEQAEKERNEAKAKRETERARTKK